MSPQNISHFIQSWTSRGDEKSDTQIFWLELLRQVFGVDNPAGRIEFEKRVKIQSTNFIDAYIAETKTLIEQKSLQIPGASPALR